MTADFISFIREGSVEIEVFAKRRVPLKAIPILPLRVGEPADITYRFGKEGDDMMNALANQTTGNVALAPMPPQVQYTHIQVFGVCLPITHLLVPTYVNSTPLSFYPRPLLSCVAPGDHGDPRAAIARRHLEASYQRTSAPT